MFVIHWQLCTLLLTSQERNRAKANVPIYHLKAFLYNKIPILYSVDGVRGCTDKVCVPVISHRHVHYSLSDVFCTACYIAIESSRRLRRPSQEVLGSVFRRAGYCLRKARPA